MSRRLYLFDIDGTLIATGGAGGAAMRAAFEAVWGLADGFRGVEFTGRTDRAILRDALIAAGLANGAPSTGSGQAFADDLRRFKRAYFRRLPHSLRAATQGRVLPGVEALLGRLAADDSATVALGTGNFRTSAGIKLRHYGLDSYFSVGGFGDGTEDRAALIAQAIRNAGRAFGRHETVFVIGDTPHDVAAARAHDAVAVAVATGTASADALAEAGADIVLPTLESATAAIL